MKLTFKLLVPLGIILIGVFAITNLIQITLFKNIFLENKALSVGDHALREIHESFDDSDLTNAQITPELLQKMKNYAKALEDPSIFRVKIWDKNYTIIYSDLTEVIGTSDEYSVPMIKEIFSSNQPVYWTMDDGGDSKTESGFGAFLRIHVPIKDVSGETRYVIELFSATSAVLAGIQSSINKTAYIFVGAGFVIFVGFYLVSNIILIRPIEKLRKAMDVVASGNFSFELKRPSKDEIGELFNHFNFMRIQINNSRDALQKEKESVEQKVEERTRELKDKTIALEKAKDEISKGWVKMQEEKARLVSSIEGLSLGFILTDKDNNILLSNSAVNSILGIQSDKWTMDDIIKKLGDTYDFKKSCLECVEKKKIVNIKEILYGAKYLRLFLAPIIMNKIGGDVIGIVILIEDVTEAKVLERSRDEFFSIASHELRTPLTSIKGNSSMIKQYYADQLKDKDLKQMIEDIHESSDRLIGIVNDFLDMSSLEQGKITFKKESFVVGELVAEVAKEFETGFKNKGLYLKIEGGDHAASVKGDRDRAKQILINLIGNAQKFTEKGGITVTIKKKGKEVVIHVSDSGRGIPPGNQSLLFRKFQQAGDSILTRDTTKGTGLGLYISKLMAEGMGGSLVLESSKEGVGSTFELNLLGA